MNRIIVRVYGVLINPNNEILLTTERYQQKVFSKFPGGGLELGEGVIDCLKREFQEEAQIDIQIENHFYTTPHFIASAFNPEEQLLSIYYKVTSHEWETIKTVPQSHLPPEGKSEVFKWVKLSEFSSEMVTFPIDKEVAELIVQTFC